LIDPRSTYSFVANKIIGELRKKPSRVEREFMISTLLGEVVNINVIYKGVGIGIDRLKLKINLILIELLDFEAILVMDWSSFCPE